MVSIPSAGHQQHLGALPLPFQPARDTLHHLLPQLVVNSRSCTVLVAQGRK